MALAVGIILVVGVGLPVPAWLATRRFTRRPLRAFSTGNRAEDWLRDELGLAWQDRAQVRRAVASGQRVGDPALAGAARELATGILSKRWPAAGLGEPGYVVIAAAGVSVAGSVLGQVTRTHGWVGYLVPYGLLLAAEGWLLFSWLPRRQRRLAARALDRNRAGPGEPRDVPSPPPSG